MTLLDLVASVAAVARIQPDRAKKAVFHTFELIASDAAVGGRTTIPRFGSFESRVRKARTIAHPRTGEPLTLPRNARLSFRASGKYQRRLAP